MTRFCTLLVLLILLRFSVSVKAETERPLQDCEQITKVALEKLVPVFNKNDFDNLESILGTIQSACGESEFTQRMRILRALIEKKTTGDLIADYLSKNYHEMLIMRWDYSIEKEYRRIYQNNKADFNYIPLKHPIDSLVKLKATALLNSPSYNLTEQEQDIAFLFADHIDEFYQSYKDTGSNKQAEPTPVEPAGFQRPAQDRHKDRHGVSIYAGLEIPVTGSDPLFKSNPTFGVMFSSKLSVPILFELGAKVRINANDRAFEYLLYDEIETVNSSASFSIGGTFGYKAFDNEKFIIYPKVGLFWESTSTGLSEVTDGYYDGGGYYYDDYNGSTSTIKYNNVNTMRTTLAVSIMRHITKKKYVGLEIAYQYIPYNWDDHLLTSIQPNYGSAQLFFRF
ncbi:hypothetical protein [Sphingobacterium suaedae]|uniref:Outer membrane protein beta-barrel domain-containing protein n=1 Tax=Sphingobacterium suaedae TaxID=1686402 RepID=A0ABW5KJI4_9SPHI